MPRLSSAQSIRDAKAGLQRFLRHTQTVTAQEMEALRVRIETGAKAQVPVDTGRLHDSIKVTISRSKSRPGINASAVARSPTTGYNYAPIQHENPLYQHETGKWHFISDPYNEEVRKFKERVRRRLRRNG